MRFQAPRGTYDCLPSESHKWNWLESEFRALAQLYNYKEIRTPTFEETDLFVRTSGDTSDIVTKQMYSFEDKGGRNITLKPEGTAPIVRSVIEHSLCQPGSVCRLSYVTPIYRYERPQKGRCREAHQVGLELIGSASGAADAEIIEITVRFYERIGVPEPLVLLNSLGRSECRDRYRSAILEHAKGYLADQTEETRLKITKNPLRLLDSKDDDAQTALSGLPPITDFLEDDSKKRLAEVQRLLAQANVSFRLAPEIARGLDYYTETVFEVHSSHLGAQSALCGGGRYDDLVQQLGGAATPAVGVAMGIERALLVLDALKAGPDAVKPDVAVVAATDNAIETCRMLARELRSKGIAVTIDIDGRSLKSQMKGADRENARFAVIIGDEELAEGVVSLRNLATSEQTKIPTDKLAEAVRSDS